MDAASAVLLNLLVAVCPKLPYEGRFTCEIRPGLQIIIMGQTHTAYRKGLISPDREGFIINLNVGDDYIGFRVLHLNPRFDQTMVLNTRENTIWGDSETHPKHNMAGDKDFILVIQAHENEFKIFENGHHFADFKYRYPVKSVTEICIKGLLNVHQFVATQYNLSTLPVPAIYNASDVIVQKGFPITIENPKIPLEVPIPGNMQVGMVVAVVGTPSENTWFSINWLTNDGNATFSFNPLMAADTHAVLHTYANGMWTPTGIIAESLFQANKRFYLFVKTRLTHFEVWLNGVCCGDFDHQIMPLQNVSKFGICLKYGAIQIDNVTLTY